MIIGYDAKRAFNNSSGLGNYSRDVIRAIHRYKNDDLFLFTTRINNKFFHIEDVKIIEPSNSLLKAYWRSFSVSKDIKRLNLDIFHGLSNEIPYGISGKTKTVITVHDLIFKRYPQWYNRFDRIIYDKKVKYGVENSDKIIAISEQTKKDIIQFYGIDENKIAVVYQTCNDIFKQKADENMMEKIVRKYSLPEKYLLYVGTIEPRKNAFNIVKVLHKHQIDIPLVIVGRDTPYASEIKEYIIKNKLEKQISIYNNVLTEELPVFYQKAEIFIYPSTFEGFGIPIIEALYSGTPVITSKGGCFPEAGGGGSIYVDPDDPDELAEAINMLLNNTEEYRKICNNGIKHVKKFDTKKVTDDLYNVYLSL